MKMKPIFRTKKIFFNCDIIFMTFSFHSSSHHIFITIAYCKNWTRVSHFEISH